MLKPTRGHSSRLRGTGLLTPPLALAKTASKLAPTPRPMALRAAARWPTCGLPTACLAPHVAR
eukprot:11754447-Prorocentrum_lima.AAC.1